MIVCHLNNIRGLLLCSYSAVIEIFVSCNRHSFTNLPKKLEIKITWILLHFQLQKQFYNRKCLTPQPLRVMPISHFANQPSCHHAPQPLSLSQHHTYHPFIPINHQPSEPSCQFSHHAYQTSYLLTIMPISHQNSKI